MITGTTSSLAMHNHPHVCKNDHIRSSTIAVNPNATAKQEDFNAVASQYMLLQEKSTAVSETLGHCMLKTKGDNYKGYEIYIIGNEIIFSRPKSSKYKELRYDLNSI